MSEWATLRGYIVTETDGEYTATLVFKGFESEEDAHEFAEAYQLVDEMMLGVNHDGNERLH